MTSDGPGATLLDWWLVVQGSALLVVSPVALWLAFGAVASAWRDEDRSARRWLLGATVVGALLRCVVAPKSIATLFLGYRSVTQALELPVVPHYGATVFLWWRALLEAFGHDHAVLLWSNALLGSLTLPLFGAYALRLLKDREAALVATWLVAVLPLFVRNDTSDAVQVPITAWLLAGLLLLDRWLATQDPRSLVGAAVFAALVALARPEWVVVVVALWGAHLRLDGKVGWRRDRLFLGCAVAFALLLVPHALHVAKHAFVLQGRSSLPGLDPARLPLLPLNLVVVNVLFRPNLYPLAATLLAGWAVWRAEPSGRRVLWVPLAGALAVQAVSMVDLGWPNMARVLAPEALLATLVAAVGVVGLFRTAGPVVRGGVVVVLVASVVPTATTLFAPTNERTEEGFIRDAIARLPRAPLVLLRVDESDVVRSPGGPPSRTHTHFPDYEIEPPAGPGEVRGLHEWFRDPRAAVPVFAFLGLRCFAEYREPDEPRPAGEHRLPACARLAASFELKPVLELDVTNHGDVWIDYYGDAASFRVGLYEVGAARPGPPPQAW